MSMQEFEEEREVEIVIPSLGELAASLENENEPIAKRMRTVFLLKQIGGPDATNILQKGLHSRSVLLGHECGYVLGQMQDTLAIPALTEVLRNDKIDPIVRHECAEALAAIDSLESLSVLEQYCNDPASEVAETCLIGVEKMKRSHQLIEENNSNTENNITPPSKYYSVDPAPPLPNSTSVPELQKILSDPSLSYYQRYRAMFSLRNLGTEESILALAAGVTSSSSPVFKHEIAYVLGQIQHKSALPILMRLLADVNEHSMVRHEAAEAIGSIAEKEGKCAEMLKEFENEGEKGSQNEIVAESCKVALDLVEYWNNDEISTAVRSEEGDETTKENQLEIMDIKKLTAEIKIK